MLDFALPTWVIWLAHGSVVLVFIIGLLCFFLREELIRQIVGFKLMLQSISLGLIITGWQKNNLYFTQTLVISALIVEAVVLGLALTMIVHISKHPEQDSGTLSQSNRMKRKDNG